MNYYEQQLHASKLFSVYQTRYPRVLQYLEAEIDYVRHRLNPTHRVLELGAGYGRILKSLAPHAAYLLGVDISEQSVALGEQYLKDCPNCELRLMDANRLNLEETFDVVLCLQNGLSALKAQPLSLISQCMAVLSPGGRLYLSTYSDKFWEHRLAWFYEQADKGLLGEIDPEKTRDGVIVCKDGFTAVTHSADDLRAMAKQSGRSYELQEVDASSLFLILEA